MRKEKEARHKGDKGFGVRLPPDLFAAVQAEATKDRRSMNAEIAVLLDEALRARRGA